MTAGAAAQRDYLKAVAHRCQVLHGVAVAEGLDPAIPPLLTLVDDCPDDLQPPEQALLQHVLVRFLLRIFENLFERDADTYPASLLRFAIGTFKSRELAAKYRSLSSALIAEYLDRPRRRSPPAAPDARVRRALEIIRRDCSNPTLSPSLLAHTVGVSAAHLNRLFRTSTGQGVSDHIRRARISHAKTLLSTTVLTIKEIAFAVGYSGTVQLDRNFRALEEKSPREYRRRLVPPR